MLKIHYPHKPYQISQHWGNLNSAYSEQFGNPSFKRHNGVDSVSSYIDPTTGRPATNFLVYCPVEGFRVSEVAYYPEGGGNQLGLVSKEKIQLGDKLCYVSILLCHAKKILVKVGDEPKVGELLMIANNTGFSTGLHLHTGIYRLNDKYQKIDSNEATGSYNLETLFSGEFAVDKATYQTLFTSGLRYFNYLIS